MLTKMKRLEATQEERDWGYHEKRKNEGNKEQKVKSDFGRSRKVNHVEGKRCSVGINSSKGKRKEREKGCGQ